MNTCALAWFIADHQQLELVVPMDACACVVPTVPAEVGFNVPRWHCISRKDARKASGIRMPVKFLHQLADGIDGSG